MYPLDPSGGCRMPCLYVNDCRLTTARTPRNACFRRIHGLLVSRLWRVVVGACDFTDWLRVVSAAMRTWENVGWEKPGREQTHEDDAARTAACCIGNTKGWNPSTGSSIAATRDNPTDLDIVYMFDSPPTADSCSHIIFGARRTCSPGKKKCLSPCPCVATLRGFASLPITGGGEQFFGFYSNKQTNNGGPRSMSEDAPCTLDASQPVNL